jgi:NADPH:quinone reductase-like Zn-dependent oxidoreductase
MKAIIINQYGAPSVLKWREIDKPRLKSKQLLVKVYASSVNPVDWKIRRGDLRFFSGWKFPRPMGADFAGIVEALGQQVTRFQPGDEVYGFVSPLRGGAYAEYVALPETSVEIKPKNLTFEQAAALPVAGLTALQSLLDLGRIQAGQQVLVNGAAGGVGSFAVQIAKALSAEVTGVCSSKNIEFVQGLGADATVDYTQEDFIHQAAQYDIIFDAVAKKSFAECQKVLKPRGIYISTLPTLRNLWDICQTFFLSKQKAKLIVVQSSSRSLQRLRQLIEAGQVSPFIDRSYPISEVAQAHARGETERTVGKIALIVVGD